MCLRTVLLLVMAVAALGAPRLGRAAIRVRKPAVPQKAVGRKPTPSRGFFVGSVIFVRGSQIVAELPGGTRPKERFIVFDPGLRRKGKAVVVRKLDQDVVLLKAEGRFSVSSGDRLARESEQEAAARVLRANRLQDYREFLELFPKSRFRPRIAREMFRLVLKSSYPTFPGSVIEGRIRLVEAVSQEIPLAQVGIKLDRFIIARTDGKGRFRIEGIPKLPEAVRVELGVKDPKFRLDKPVAVELPAGKLVERAVEIPVKLTPTLLVGTVVDERGAPLPAAEVWTAPYTMEVLTDDAGGYRIARRKRTDAGEGETLDEPLLGGEYEVFAFRKGYTVGHVTVSAESFRHNPVPPIRLERMDLAAEPLPELNVDLARFLELPSESVQPAGAGPRISP